MFWGICKPNKSKVTAKVEDPDTVASVVIFVQVKSAVEEDYTPWTSGDVMFNYNDGNTSNILEYPIFSEANKDGGWVKTNTENTYQFRVMGTTHTFLYDRTTGTFNCTAGTYCDDLTR